MLERIWPFSRMVSADAKAIIWLWHNDPAGWVRGRHAVAHPDAGVGVWTSNQIYGLDLRYGIPKHEARDAFILSGCGIKPNRVSRTIIFKAIKNGDSSAPVAKAVQKWAMHNIETMEEPSHAL